MTEPMIKSMLDQDLYKFAMMQAVCLKFPNERVKYKFIMRGDTKFPDGFGEKVQLEIERMERLQLLPTEKQWMSRTTTFLTPYFLDFLEGFRYNSKEVEVTQKGDNLEIVIEGYWYRTILWEVPIMAIVSELYFIETGQKPTIDWKAKIKVKRHQIIDVILLAGFATRRRYSWEVQDYMVGEMKKATKNFVGTSNVHLAMKHKLKPIGTQAHEWFMFHGGKFGYVMANKLALENWIEVYQGDLGIALTDTYTTDNFFANFNVKYAKLFDGVRHDSGNAFRFADEMINHYKYKLGIDPMTKVIIFSDGLNIDKALEIQNYCAGKIKCSFGIGTNLSNDVGVKPLNMVIKMTHFFENGIWKDVVKLSDSKGKHTGNANEVNLCKKVLGLLK